MKETLRAAGINEEARIGQMADTGFFSILGCAVSDFPPGGLLAFHHDRTPPKSQGSGFCLKEGPEPWADPG